VVGHFLGPCLRTARLILARLQRQVLPHARLTVGRLAMPPISPLAHHRSSFRCVRIPLAANDAVNLRATRVRVRAPSSNVPNIDVAPGRWSSPLDCPSLNGERIRCGRSNGADSAHNGGRLAGRADGLGPTGHSSRFLC
jgi:hypothetical protein